MAQNHAPSLLIRRDGAGGDEGLSVRREGTDVTTLTYCTRAWPEDASAQARQPGELMPRCRNAPLDCQPDDLRWEASRWCGGLDALGHFLHG